MFGQGPGFKWERCGEVSLVFLASRFVLGLVEVGELSLHPQDVTFDCFIPQR